MCLPGTREAVGKSVDADTEGRDPIRLSRRTALAAGMGGAMAALVPRPAAAGASAPAGRRRHVQDLTHPLGAGFPVYAGDPPSRRTLTTVAEDGFYSQAWEFGEHSGTHLDAPGHFVAGGRRVADLDVDELVAPAAVIDVSDRAERDADTAVTPDDIRRYERRHGRIPRGAVVFMYSGWERRLGDPAAFTNADADGVFHFPGFGFNGVEYLLDERAITGIGVDTLSLDVGASASFGVHGRLLAADHYGLENVANLQHLPPSGATVVVGVIPWEEGSGGPCRLLAMY